jgi:cyclophilin family peptidyl-prolyl cis-trans isomerase/protein-disulfide isomerase
MRLDPRVALPFLALFLTACGPEAALPTLTSTAPPPTVGTLTSTPPSPTPVPRATAHTRTPLPPLAPAEWTRGPETAWITLDVYCDFVVTGCAALAPLLDEVLSRHPDDLRLIYHQYPLITLNDKASLAAQAAEAAGAQGRFWEMYDVLYGDWSDWVTLPAEDFPDWVVGRAEGIGLDAGRLEEDLAQAAYAPVVEEASRQIAALGIQSVPVVYLNGDLVQLDLNLNNLEAATRLELLSSRQYESPPPMLIDPEATYRATLQLDRGEIVIDLFPASAPMAVNSFVFLAGQGWFDGCIFHRVLPGTLAETGDPSGTGLGGPGYFFATEIDPALTFEEAGVVALTSAGLGTNGSQFFITLAPLPQLNGTRSVFGRVASGLEILQGLARRDPLFDLLNPPGATILRVTIEER